MFGSSGGSSLGALIPIAVVVGIVLLRNSRPRRLRIESLWILPVVYVLLLASSLAAAPPPVTPVSIGLLALGFVLGAAIGWQRGRFTRIDIHPETHDLTSRQSMIGIVFILAIFAVRYGARDFLAANASSLHLPVVAALDALLVLAIAMLSVQRLEVWLRASRMLAEAKGATGPTRPPNDLVR
ncbi:MAG TPA: DUF1453 domain-containing protein [Caulobacteraceae bacterium]|nr:DUF1453 domain-containing protein [Caulobacteraceae bacterium]